jgi:hypothetical protein
MSLCTCCGEDVNAIDEQACDVCDAVMCNDCFLTHDGICDECNADGNDVDNIVTEDLEDEIF